MEDPAARSSELSLAVPLEALGSLRLSGADPYRRHQPEAGTAGTDGQPIGADPGAAIG